MVARLLSLRSTPLKHANKYRHHSAPAHANLLIASHFLKWGWYRVESPHAKNHCHGQRVLLTLTYRVVVDPVRVSGRINQPRVAAATFRALTQKKPAYRLLCLVARL